eukprot:2910579-Karenia_brevis.AAC.1
MFRLELIKSEQVREFMQLYQRKVLSDGMEKSYVQLYMMLSKCLKEESFLGLCEDNLSRRPGGLGDPSDRSPIKQ